MALPRKSLEKALLYILRNPTAVIPAPHPDNIRSIAATDLASLAFSSDIGSTPHSTDSANDLFLTVNRLGGRTTDNVDSFARVRWPIVEVATWVRESTMRTNRQNLLDMGECLDLLLNGLSGTFENVEICLISSEVDPFQQDDPPGDGSDRWIAGYTYTYEIQYVGAVADHRVAVAVDGP